MEGATRAASQVKKVEKSVDQLVAAKNDQEKLLEYLIQAIPNLEQQILQVLVDFRNDYLSQNQQE